MDLILATYSSFRQLSSSQNQLIKAEFLFLNLRHKLHQEAKRKQ